MEHQRNHDSPSRLSGTEGKDEDRPHESGVRGQERNFPTPRLLWAARLILFLALALCALPHPGSAVSRTVKVGVYQNPPLIFTERSEPKGIFISVLQEVARREGWKLTYVKSDWETVLERVKRGDIDVLPVVAANRNRLDRLDFSRESLLSNWGEVFTRTGLKVASIGDLKGRRIALQSQDTHAAYFAELMDKLGISFRRVTVKQYQDVFRALEEEEADAGVVNRLFADMNARHFAVRSTPIVFHPVEIRYAVPEGDPAKVLPALNRILPELKEQQDTAYDRALERWLGASEAPPRYPEWLLELLFVLGALFTIGGLAIAWLRIEVKRKTRELRRTNAMLAESESKYRRVLETAMDGFLLVSPWGRIVEVNPAYAGMSGYSTEELVGIRIDRLAIGEGRSGIGDQLKRVLRSGAERFETRHRHKDGSIFHVEVSISYDSRGAGLIAAFVRDVSERRHMEEALRKSEERFQLAMEASRDGIWDWDLESDEVFYSPGYVAMLGYSTAAPPRSASFWKSLIHPEDKADVLKANRDCIENRRESFEIEFRMQTKQGEWRWILGRGKAVERDNRGRALRMVGTHTDMTEKNRIQEYLSQYKNMISCTPDAFALLDRNYRYVIINDAYEKFSGMKKDELIGKTVSEYLGDEVFQEYIKPNFDECLKGKDVRYQRWFDFPNLGMLFVEAYYFPYLDKHKNITGVIAHIRDITDKKIKDEKLKYNEKMYRLLAENTVDCIWTMDTDYVFTYVNPAIYDLTGYTEDEWIGTSIYEIFKEDQLELIFEKIREVFQRLPDNDSVSFEVYLYHKQGALVWVEINGRLTLDEDGNPNGMQGIARNITQRKQAEEALRESEEKYRLLAENSADVIWTMDLKGRYTFVSPSVQRVYGVTPEQVIGASVYDHLPPEEQEFVERFLEQPPWESMVSDTETPVYRSELRQFKRDGSVFWTEVLASPMWGSKGAIAGYQGATRDITDRKEMEATLLEEKEKYRKLFETSPDAIALVDEDGRFLTVNPAMAGRLGLSRQELQGRTFWDVMPRQLANQRIVRGREAIERGSLVYHEDEEENRYFQNYSVPLSGSGDRNTFQVISRDVTQSRQLQERLKEMGLHDALTRLYNRAYFEEEMRRLADGRYMPLGIIVCDINGLKLINDTLGHGKGDELLQVVAGILRQCFRDSDILARIGGDEFAVLLPSSNREVVSDCCERIRRQVAGYQERDPEFGISISVGYAVKEEAPVDMDALFKKADDAMYKEKLQQSYSSRSEIVQALIKTLEARDFISEGHVGRMHEHAQRLGKAAGLSEERLNDLQLLARFHDLGKVGVPDRILFKPGRLTDEEFQEMQQHCEIGHRIAMSTSDLAPIADYILKHHEHWDGGGYPLGLSGEAIPLECRILAIVDAYDTMTSERPYNIPMSRDEALRELERCAGTQFDPNLVHKFVRMVREG
jgi:diguanylate cyclase (GGDEF)-like protein/PAS domain S-box-containing protein